MDEKLFDQAKRHGVRKNTLFLTLTGLDSGGHGLHRALRQERKTPSLWHQGDEAIEVHAGGKKPEPPAQPPCERGKHLAGKHGNHGIVNLAGAGAVEEQFAEGVMIVLINQPEKGARPIMDKTSVFPAGLSWRNLPAKQGLHEDSRLAPAHHSQAYA